MAKIGETRNNPMRVIDTWFYKVKDVTLDRLDYVSDPEDREDDSESAKYVPRKERITNKTVKIELRMNKRTTHSEEPPHPLESVELELYCAELNVKIRGHDIEAMRATMWSVLDKKFEITWEQQYLVEIRRARIYGGEGEGLELSYDDVYKGTTYDGKLLLKEWKGHDYRIRLWPGEFKDEGGKVMACIPATDFNKEALKEFGRRIGALREKLADFLRPEKIVQTLADMNSLAKLLPPAPPKKEEDEETERANAN